MKGKPNAKRKAVGDPIIGALRASQTYRNFAHAFRELTGLNITLDQPDIRPRRLSERSFNIRVPVPTGPSPIGIVLVAYSRRSISRSKKAVAAALELLQVFAKHLALLSTQISLRAHPIEPPLIQRAKAYIEANYIADLSLASIARFLGVSRFYFCKLFKKATGLTLSTYVARVRIERAKRLLLDPNARISEIAFEVGFQSLTHFNRAFRRVCGCSPTKYRKNVCHD